MAITPSKGFTLIELIVALAVAAILIGVGVPSFVTMMSDTRLGSERDKLVQALYLARSEAAKRSTEVTVCPKSGPETRQCGTDWTQGLVVFIDGDTVAGETTAVVGADDTILRLTPATPSTVDIAGIGSTGGTAATAAGRNFIRYTARGSTNWRNASFTLCDDRGAADAEAVNIVLTGDIRRARSVAGGTTPLDVFNRAVTCPGA